MTNYPSSINLKFQLALLQEIRRAGGREIGERLRSVMLRRYKLPEPRGADIKRWRNIISWALIEIGPPTQHVPPRGKKWLRKPFAGQNAAEREREWIQVNRPGYAHSIVWEMTRLGIAQLNGIQRTTKYNYAVEAEGRKAEEQGDFDPPNKGDARRHDMRSIAQRRGQRKFRRELLKNYEGKCAFSCCAVEEILEAAHILPYKGDKWNHPQNGLLLRADLHTLFDLGLLAVDTRDMTLIVASSLKRSDYAKLNGLAINLPKESRVRPSTTALDTQRRDANLDNQRKNR